MESEAWRSMAFCHASMDFHVAALLAVTAGQFCSIRRRLMERPQAGAIHA